MARGARLPVTEFRSSMTTPEGLHKTDIFQGRVVNVDTLHWTVDVVSQFDQMLLADIPVGSMYQHFSRGEGIYVMPEVGAKCAVCWPGDSSPPFVMAFVMPHEIESTASEEAPAGSESRGDTDQSPVTASFGGGRPKAKPGDIIMRGRDGNQVVLHRGGVLQIGANELSQRVYIPLQNMILDFCENYSMHNSGGSINWGIQEGEGKNTLPSIRTETYRVYASDKYADIRVSQGKVHTPAPDSDTGIQELEVGKSDSVVYEFALSKNGFRAEDGGNIQATGANLKFRVIVDRAGNAAIRADGNVYIRCKKRLKINVGGDIEVIGGGNLNAQFSGSLKVNAEGVAELTAPTIILNGGDKPAARVGDTVTIPLPPQLLIASPNPPGFAPLVTNPLLLNASGVITGPGNSTVLI